MRFDKPASGFWCPVYYAQGERIYAEINCETHGKFTIQSGPLEKAIVIETVRCPFCADRVPYKGGIK